MSGSVVFQEKVFQNQVDSKALVVDKILGRARAEVLSHNIASLPNALLNGKAWS